MQRRHSGAGIPPLEELNLGGNMRTTGNGNGSMTVGNLTRPRAFGGGIVQLILGIWKRPWRVIFGVLIGAFCWSWLVVLEIYYQRGCDVSIAYSHSVAHIGRVTLFALEDIGVTHWLAFSSLLHAYVLEMKHQVVEPEVGTMRKIKAPNVDIAVDMHTLQSEDFWKIVTVLEGHGMHVMYYPEKRVMKVFENQIRQDAVYTNGIPHSNVWFFSLEPSTKQYFIQNRLHQKHPTNLAQAFFQQDVLPLKQIQFLDRLVYIPNNSQKVIAQEYPTQLRELSSHVKGRMQCMQEIIDGVTFYETPMARPIFALTFVVVWITSFVVIHKMWYHKTKRRTGPARYTDADQKAFV